jgi:hypothetical protein
MDLWYISTTAEGDDEHTATGHWLDVRVPTVLFRLLAHYGRWRAHRAARHMGVNC